MGISGSGTQRDPARGCGDEDISGKRSAGEITVSLVHAAAKTDEDAGSRAGTGCHRETRTTDRGITGLDGIAARATVANLSITVLTGSSGHRYCSVGGNGNVTSDGDHVRLESTRTDLIVSGVRRVHGETAPGCRNGSVANDSSTRAHTVATTGADLDKIVSRRTGCPHRDTTGDRRQRDIARDAARGIVIRSLGEISAVTDEHTRSGSGAAIKGRTRAAHGDITALDAVAAGSTVADLHVAVRPGTTAQLYRPADRCGNDAGDGAVHIETARTKLAEGARTCTAAHREISTGRRERGRAGDRADVVKAACTDMGKGILAGTAGNRNVPGSVQSDRAVDRALTAAAAATDLSECADTGSAGQCNTAEVRDRHIPVPGVVARCPSVADHGEGTVTSTG